jgi:hypothetical protein
MDGEVVYNLELTKTLLAYFQAEAGKEDEFQPVQHEIQRMTESGVIKPIIFTYLLTIFQILRITGSREGASSFDMNQTNIRRMKKVLMAIFEDEEYVEKAARQLFSYYIITSTKISTS